MNSGMARRVGEVSPDRAWDILCQNQSSALVDVRTRAEWAFVGLPDLSSLGREPVLVEWVQYPSMAPNSQFVEQLTAALGDALPDTLLFICRSGQRSRFAAQAVAEQLSGAEGVPELLNVAEGFEGDLDSQGHRGGMSGWKHRGLPWRQS